MCFYVLGPNFDFDVNWSSRSLALITNALFTTTSPKTCTPEGSLASTFWPIHLFFYSKESPQSIS